MKVKLPSIIYLLLLSILINACNKDDCDNSTVNKYVDQSYVPYIIPYSDTSTRLFLKNGTDTLLFKSQGLKESTEFYQESAINGYCRKYCMQKLSLKLAASDTVYFLLNYYADRDGTLFNDYEIVNGNNYSKSESDLSRDFVNYFPTIEKTIILNNSYDSIRNYTNSFGDIFIARPKTGVLKIQTKRVLYELIK